MSIFSKLSGTMERVFMLGKKGIKLSNSNNTELQVKSNDGVTLVPVSGANPIQNTHFVTLEYFNNNGGGGPGPGGADILKGTADPTPTLGSEGSVYFKVDGTVILAIYIKDTGVWKIYEVEKTSTNFKKPINVADWSSTSDGFTLVVNQTEHNEGSELVISVYENTIAGNTSSAPFRQIMLDCVISDEGNITLTSTSKFSGKIVISGK